MTNTNKMAVMPMNKLLFDMSLPIVISMVASALYNIIDSVFVSHYSKTAFDAVSLCYPIQQILVAVAVGTALSIQALLARSLGENNKDKAQQVLCHGLLMSAIHSLLFLVAGLFFAEKFMMFFTSDAELIAQGAIYFRICTIFGFGINIQIAFERVMQATGNAVYNLYIQAVGAIINCILDPILIFGLIGEPMGIKGAAIATVIGQMVAMAIGIILTIYKVKEVNLSFKNFKFDKELFKQMYEIAIPAICMSSIMSIATVFINKILSAYSPSATTAFGVYFKLYQFLCMAINGISNAVIAIISFNYGARLKDRIRECIKLTLISSCVIMIIGMIIFLLFPNTLLSMFNPDQEMHDIAIVAMRICSLSFIGSAINIQVCSFLQALDGSKQSLFLSLLRQLIILIPLAYLLSLTKGLNALWWSFPISETLVALLSFRLLIQINHKIDNI